MAEQTTGSQAAKPRTYTDEYRRQVVDMVTATGRTAMSVAAEPGEWMLSSPKREAFAAGASPRNFCGIR